MNNSVNIFISMIIGKKSFNGFHFVLQMNLSSRSFLWYLIEAIGSLNPKRRRFSQIKDSCCKHVKARCSWPSSESFNSIYLKANSSWNWLFRICFIFVQIEYPPNSLSKGKDCVKEMRVRVRMILRITSTPAQMHLTISIWEYFGYRGVSSCPLGIYVHPSILSS